MLLKNYDESHSLPGGKVTHLGQMKKKKKLRLRGEKLLLG